MATIPMLDAISSTRLDSHAQDVAHACRFAPTPSGSRPAWCVAASLPKTERRAHAELHRRGFETYLPLITVRRPNRHSHTGPLFPGYLFVRLDLSRPWNPVTYCPGVFGLINVNGIPSICPDGAVEALQALEHARRDLLPEMPVWAPGMPCRLATGVFEGHQAVILSASRKMATVALMMPGHLCETTVSLDALAPRSD